MKTRLINPTPNPSSSAGRGNNWWLTQLSQSFVGAWRYKSHDSVQIILQRHAPYSC